LKFNRFNELNSINRFKFRVYRGERKTEREREESERGTQRSDRDREREAPLFTYGLSFEEHHLFSDVNPCDTKAFANFGVKEMR